LGIISVSFQLHVAVSPSGLVRNLRISAGRCSKWRRTSVLTRANDEPLCGGNLALHCGCTVRWMRHHPAESHADQFAGYSAAFSRECAHLRDKAPTHT